MSTNKDEANLMERITSENTVTLYSSDDLPTTPDNEVHTRTNVLESLPPDLPVEINKIDTEFINMESIGGGDGMVTSTEEREQVAMVTSPVRREQVTMETRDLQDHEEDGRTDLYECVKLLANVVKKGLYDYQLKDGLVDGSRDHCVTNGLLNNKEGVVNENDAANKEGVVNDDTPTKVTEKLSPEDLEKMEKLRKALAKMRRLDNKLAEVMKKEREVKRRRRHSSHDHTPLQDDLFKENIFKTQPIEGSHDQDIRVECVEGSQSDSCTAEPGTESVGYEKSQSTTSGQRLKENNFIERNKELASEKGDVLMTEHEKMRLEQLLMEGDEEGPIDSEQDHNNIKIDIPEGYSFTDEEIMKLEEIDRALEQVMPSISKTPSVLSHITDNGCGPGEGVLASLQATRSEQQRLKEIDYLLTTLTEGEDPDNDVIMKISISNEQLSMLLQQCQPEPEN